MIRNMVSVRTVWVIEFDMGLSVRMFGFIVLFHLEFKLFNHLPCYNIWFSTLALVWLRSKFQSQSYKIEIQKARKKMVSILVNDWLVFTPQLCTPLRNEFLCQLFRALRKQWISANIKVWHPWQMKNIKIVGGVLELPAKQYCQSSLFT